MGLKTLSEVTAPYSGTTYRIGPLTYWRCDIGYWIEHIEGEGMEAEQADIDEINRLRMPEKVNKWFWDNF